MKMQIAFRRLVGQKFGEYQVAAAVGLFDLPAGHERFDECVANFHMPLSPDGTQPEKSICFRNPRPLNTVADSDTRSDMRKSNIEAIIKAKIKRSLPSDSSNAHFFFRKTDVASKFAGGSVYAFAGTLAVHNVLLLDCDDVLEFASDLQSNSPSTMNLSGRVGRTIRPEFGETNLVSDMQGAPLSQFLVQPIWGFGSEPIALGSTLELDRQRMYEKYTELYFQEDRTVMEQQRYMQLRILADTADMLLFHEEPALARVLWHLRQHDDYVPAFRPKTREEFNAINEATRDAYASIERGDDDEYFAAWRAARDDGELDSWSGDSSRSMIP